MSHQRCIHGSREYTDQCFHIQLKCSLMSTWTPILNSPFSILICAFLQAAFWQPERPDLAISVSY